MTIVEAALDADRVDGGHDALAADGAIVRIRPVVPADRRALADLYGRTSDENLYRRFLCAGRGGIAAELDRLTRPDDGDHVVAVAIERGRLVGVASAERVGRTATAEFAVLVDDVAHGRGIGTLLLEELAAAARRAGVTDLVGDVLASNGPMLTVARDLGPELRVDRSAGVVEVHIPTDETADNAALEARNRYAERNSLTPLLAPRAIAVVGAGRNPRGIGHQILEGLVAGGFAGPVYPVGPHAAYRSCRDLPGPVDLAIVAVPAAGVRGWSPTPGRRGSGPRWCCPRGSVRTGRRVGPRRPTWCAPPAGTASGWSVRTASASWR
jgi:GNAT superfamily N-acetyltransferase